MAIAKGTHTDMPTPTPDSGPKKLETVILEKTGALSPDDTIITAGERMRSADANSWPVAEGRKLVGVIDQCDPDRQTGGRGHDPAQTRVRDEMRHQPHFCYEDQDAAEAQRIMIEKNLNHLTVVDREMRILGIISRAEAEQSIACAAPASAPLHDRDWAPEKGSSGILPA